MHFCFTLFSPVHTDAQDTVVVEPGLGTLEASISANGNSVVYLLQAGERYGLSRYVEVRDDGSGNALRISGQESVNIPAVIQVGTDSVGETYPQLFQVYSDLTLSNLFLTSITPRC